MGNKIMNLDQRIIHIEKQEAPKIVKVYHEFFIDDDILSKEGIKTLDEQNGEEIRGGNERINREKIIDELRPKDLKEKNISRFNIFAYPYNPKNEKSYFNFLKDKTKIAEINVDGNKCYVLDMKDYSGAMANLKNEESLVRQGQIKKEDFILEERIKVWFSEYWKKAISLSDFLEDYRYDKNSDSFVLRADKENDILPKQFYLPEVLVPNKIEPADIKIINNNDLLA